MKKAKKIYLIIHSGAVECEGWSEIFAFANRPNAKKKFNELVEQETEHAENVCWEIDSEDGYFSSYESGCYNENHTDVTLEETELF